MSDPSSDFDIARLRQITDDMITAITSPPLVDAMRQLRNAAPATRLTRGAELLDTDKLRAAGVPFPKDMLISSRYFEPDTGQVIKGGDLPNGRSTVRRSWQCTCTWYRRMRMRRKHNGLRRRGRQHLGISADRIWAFKRLRTASRGAIQMSNYHALDFDREELSLAMRKAYDDIIEFITTPEFQAIHRELMSLQIKYRPAYVAKIILDRDELLARGLVVPEGILIQASAFGDRRPTLFAVKKFLPKKFHKAWENVNWTFSNEFDIDEIRKRKFLACSSSCITSK